MTEKPPRSRRADYPHLRPVPTRWADNDVYGHVNNVAYYAFFDTAVNAFLIENGVLDPKTSEVIGLVVETSCRYHAPLSFPETLTAGVRVARLGNSSVTYELAIFGEGADEAAAEGRFTHVYVDAETRRPVQVPEAMRGVLAGLLPNHLE
ncbi:MAG: thioesterase family protein [Pseudomonadota bacterium]